MKPRQIGTTLLCAAIAMIACASAPKPQPPPVRNERPLPEGAVRLTAIPADYAIWYGEIKECVGYSRVEFQDIQWYSLFVKDGRGFRWPPPPKDTMWAAGLAYSSLNAIVMGHPWLLKPGELRHEILHLAGSPWGHDPELYQRKCAHLVTCVAGCLTDTLNTR